MAITRDIFLQNREMNEVLRFLVKNKKHAWTVAEMSSKLKLKRNEISTKLRDLKKKRKVLHKKPYWLAK